MKGLIQEKTPNRKFQLNTCQSSELSLEGERGMGGDGRMLSKQIMKLSRKVIAARFS